MAHSNHNLERKHVIDGVTLPNVHSADFRAELISALETIIADRATDQAVDIDKEYPPVAGEPNFGKLRVATTDVLEVAVALTTYISPNQHGNIHGKIVHRRYIAIPDIADAGTTTVLDIGITITGSVIDLGGMVELEAGGTFYPLPYTDIAAAGDASISMSSTLDDITLTKTTLVSDYKAGGFVWIDFFESA